MSTIFLDRDGVINENRSDYVKSWDEFCFVAGAKEAIAMLTHAGHRIIVCTNQAGVASGRVAQSMVEDIHRRMRAEIAQVGGSIEQVYCCLHAKDANCSCRKPRPGMLLQARDELGLDLHDALLIGDSITDIRAALAAGIHPILVLTGLGRQHLRERSQEADGPFHIAESLKETAEIILQGGLVACPSTCGGTGAIPLLTSSLSSTLNGEMQEKADPLLPCQRLSTLTSMSDAGREETRYTRKEITQYV